MLHPLTYCSIVRPVRRLTPQFFLGSGEGPQPSHLLVDLSSIEEFPRFDDDDAASAWA